MSEAASVFCPSYNKVWVGDTQSGYVLLWVLCCFGNGDRSVSYKYKCITVRGNVFLGWVGEGVLSMLTEGAWVEVGCKKVE